MQVKLFYFIRYSYIFLALALTVSFAIICILLLFARLWKTIVVVVTIVLIVRLLASEAHRLSSVESGRNETELDSFPFYIYLKYNPRIKVKQGCGFAMTWLLLWKWKREEIFHMHTFAILCII